jgi:hypothetical protein
MKAILICELWLTGDSGFHVAGYDCCNLSCQTKQEDRTPHPGHKITMISQISLIWGGLFLVVAYIGSVVYLVGHLLTRQGIVGVVHPKIKDYFSSIVEL